MNETSRNAARNAASNPPTGGLTRARVAAMIDHTLLSTDASRGDGQALVAEARGRGT